MCIFFIENLGVQISWNCFCLNILITKKKTTQVIRKIFTDK